MIKYRMSDSGERMNATMGVRAREKTELGVGRFDDRDNTARPVILRTKATLLRTSAHGDHVVAMPRKDILAINAGRRQLHLRRLNERKAVEYSRIIASWIMVNSRGG
jgi:hypothetical protein